MKPNPNCETCGGCGVISIPYYNDLYDEYEWENEDCPECEEYEEMENEHVNP